MRMLQPSPGEVCDRQTILQLKCKHGMEKKINVQPFVDENNQLQDYLEKGWLLLANKSIQHDYDTLLKQLEVVNSRLWSLEDRVREWQQISKAQPLGEKELRDIVQDYFSITQLNDVRAGLVKQINALFGIYSQEKLHVATGA